VIVSFAKPDKWDVLGEDQREDLSLARHARSHAIDGGTALALCARMGSEAKDKVMAGTARSYKH